MDTSFRGLSLPLRWFCLLMLSFLFSVPGLCIHSPEASAEVVEFKLPWVLRNRREQRKKGDLWRILSRRLARIKLSIRKDGICKPKPAPVKGSSKHGVEVHCVLRGHVVETGKWHKGKKTDTWTLRTVGGSKIAEITYFRGLLQGPVKIWHSNGRLRANCLYRDNKKNGPCTWWYPNGKMVSRGVFKDNERYGLWKKWYHNGRKWFECPHLEDQYHGTCRQWYRNGKLMWERTYLDGKTHKRARMWYRNGSPMSVRFFHKGKPCGTAKFWDTKQRPLHSDIYLPCPTK